MIGVLTTSYPRHDDDFAGNFVRDRVQGLVRAGHAVQVLAAGNGTTITVEHPAPGIEIVRLPFMIPGAPPLFYEGGAPEALEQSGAYAWLQALRFVAQMGHAAARHWPQWNKVECHWLLPCGLLALGALRAPGASRALPLRMFAHSGDVALLERVPGGRSLARALYGSGAELVFVSDDLRARFARLCRHVTTPGLPRMFVEAMPVDAQTFRPRGDTKRRALRQRMGLSDYTIISVGRLVPIKGFDLLVRAAGRLPPGLRPTLVILGAGPGADPLTALARGRGVTLRLPGVLPRAAVADWLSASDLYVQPSRILPNGRSEGMPLGVREALAAGLPVVATAGGGLAELACPGARVTLVPPENLAALEGALRTAIGYNCETLYARMSDNVGKRCEAEDTAGPV